MIATGGGEDFGPGFIAFMVISYVLSLGLWIAYPTFFIGKYGATLGKMACQLKVVTEDGGKVTYMRALGRAFAEYLSMLTIYIGYIMAGFDDEKRTLHDRICSTRVVRK